VDKKTYVQIAEEILSGHAPDQGTYRSLAATPASRVFDLAAGADLIRESHFGRGIHLCTILNAKSGKCPEDCAFCSQSVSAKTEAAVYSLLPKDRLKEGALTAQHSPVNRYSIVTSGKRLRKKEVTVISEALQELDGGRLRYCASLGTLDREDLSLLREAGLTRYHHNLEASESFFGRICTTHTYQERVETVRAAKEVGLSVCSGGLFGMGETDDQALELALALRELGVDSVPINFLTPIKGTKLGHLKALTPLRCLKIIALFRYVLPDKEILVCGGREANLKALHPLVFYAWASGVMTGNYLTTAGRSLEQDLDLLDQLGLSIRES
jgi:biotin synthase